MWTHLRHSPGTSVPTKSNDSAPQYVLDRKLRYNSRKILRFVWILIIIYEFALAEKTIVLISCEMKIAKCMALGNTQKTSTIAGQIWKPPLHFQRAETFNKINFSETERMRCAYNEIIIYERRACFYCIYFVVIHTSLHKKWCIYISRDGRDREREQFRRIGTRHYW